MAKITADKLVKKARSYKGIKESPVNSNKCIFTEVYCGKHPTSYYRPWYWCVIFEWYNFMILGASELFNHGKKCASCNQYVSNNKSQYKKTAKDLLKGDLVYFTFSNKRTIEHTGIFLKYGKNADTIITVDGNTGSTNEANGGAVMIRERKRSCVVGRIRPAYKRRGYTGLFPGQTISIKEKASKKHVKRLQKFLNWALDAGLEIDGLCGPKTDSWLKVYQMIRSLRQDGSAGPITRTDMKKFKR